MEENLQPQQDNRRDEITLKDFLLQLRYFRSLLIKKWYYILVSGMFFGLAALGYYYIQSPKYTGECTFILEEKSSGAGGGLAGLASQFGFDLGSMGAGSSIFAGDNLLEIIPSKSMVEKVLLQKTDSLDNPTLADLYLDFTKLKKSWHKDTSLADINYFNFAKTGTLTLKQDSVLHVIYKLVIKNNLVVDWVRKKTSLIRVAVTSKNELFSKYMTERLINESKNLYIDIKTNNSQQNVNRLQYKADSLYQLLNSKSYTTAASQILNPNPAIKVAMVPSEISTRDKAVIGTIYTEVVKNLETSKILLSQQTPVIQILDKPEFPLENQKKTRFTLVLMGVLSGLFIGLVLVIYKFIRQIIKAQI